jgi:hypothetical protein
MRELREFSRCLSSPLMNTVGGTKLLSLGRKEVRHRLLPQYLEHLEHSTYSIPRALSRSGVRWQSRGFHDPQREHHSHWPSRERSSNKLLPTWSMRCLCADVQCARTLHQKTSLRTSWTSYKSEFREPNVSTIKDHGTRGLDTGAIEAADGGFHRPLVGFHQPRRENIDLRQTARRSVDA